MPGACGFQIDPQAPPTPLQDRLEIEGRPERANRNGSPLSCDSDARFGSIATEPSRAKIQQCPLLSESDQILRRSELTRAESGHPNI